MNDKPIGALDFLQKLQRLLTEGDFSATYKFALLNALADLSLERTAEVDGSLHLPVSDIAEKFIQYYWPQVRPYRAPNGNDTVLHQNSGNQAAVVRKIVEVQRTHPTLPAFRGSREWKALVEAIKKTIIDMPLWKLQTVGGEHDEFIYRKGEFESGQIRLLPGVPESFRTLYGLVLDAVRGAWLRQISNIAANRKVLGNADLASFLFGSERGNLSDYRSVLYDHQRGRCLYCEREVPGAGCVDHFIAWSRYPVDLGHGLVFADAKCNSEKRDYLAHPAHLERWRRSHMERGNELSHRLEARALPFDQERSQAIVWWAYEQGEAAGAHAWLHTDRFVKLDRTWRAVLSAEGLRRVAEPPLI